ncbi:response regulator [Streptomyces sp. J2-1]|uniref:response regulator n=1 Tax=Streptomyces corallincola TaxID=2851888 RepID=UPI001C38FDD5|nr:response regulator [Streptomyces corallincola]MBV2357060.1 response regulator [Streptomyces corallincola]
MRQDHAPGKRLDDGHVLVLEDSQEDAEAIERALSRTHPHLRLEFLTHGEGLVRRLIEADEVPGIVLLDLNMPGVGGHAVLKEIRSRPELAEMTVVVFTSSTAPAEVDACYAAGADSYIYKPLNFDLFRTVLKGAMDYWQEAKGQSQGQG